MMFLNKKNVWLLLGVIFCTEDMHAMNIEEENMKEQSKKLSISTPQNKDKEKEQANALLNRIKNLPKEALEKQNDIKGSIASGAYRNDRYWVNKEGNLVLLESK